MAYMLWVVLGVIIALGIVAGIVAYQRKKLGIKHETDYKSFFIMGLAFFAMGIINKDLYVFMILGLVYIAIGLVNKDKWKQNKPWNKLSKKEKLDYHAEAMHYNCKDCHKAHNKKTKTKDAPITCTKCHPKQ